MKLQHHALDSSGNAYVERKIKDLLDWKPAQPLAQVVEALNLNRFIAYSVTPANVQFDCYQFETGISHVDGFARPWVQFIDASLKKQYTAVYLLNEALALPGEKPLSYWLENFGPCYRTCEDAVVYCCTGDDNQISALGTAFRASFAFGHLSILAKLTNRSNQITDERDMSLKDLHDLVRNPVAIIVDAYDTDGVILLTNDWDTFSR